MTVAVKDGQSELLLGEEKIWSVSLSCEETETAVPSVAYLPPPPTMPGDPISKELSILKTGFMFSFLNMATFCLL